MNFKLSMLCYQVVVGIVKNKLILFMIFITMQLKFDVYMGRQVIFFVIRSRYASTSKKNHGSEGSSLTRMEF
jgi:hypothetical protein